MKKYLFFLFICLIASCSKNNPDEQKTSRSILSMGTLMDIVIISDKTKDAEIAISEAFAEIERISNKYSTFKNDNFMFEMNNSVDTFEIDNETYYLLKKCDEMWKLTDRRFDAAVGNLIELVGFEKGKAHLPESDSIKAILAKTGWKNVILIDSTKIYKTNGVKINLGGIIPGYVVDRISEMLKNKGFTTFMINAGGEIRGEGKDWTIGIQHPRKQNDIIGVLKINNISIATSGDYEQYFKKERKRYSHIIDPVSGLPCDNCQAVTVISKKDIDADALGTGVFILGHKKGMELIEKLKDVEALIVSQEGKIYFSSGFKKYMKGKVKI